jgi:hypothetical protein
LAVDVAKATEGLPPELKKAAHAIATSQNLINKLLMLMFWPLILTKNALRFFFAPARHPLAFVSLLYTSLTSSNT